MGKYIARANAVARVGDRMIVLTRGQEVELSDEEAVALGFVEAEPTEEELEALTAPDAEDKGE